MERVGVLINKLQEQFAQNADLFTMLANVQLLHSELLTQVNRAEGDAERKVVVVVPNAPVVKPVLSAPEVTAAHEPYKPIPKPEQEPAPVAEPTPEPEAPMPDPVPTPTPKPEPEPIPHFVEQKPWGTLFPPKEDKGSKWAVDPLVEVPTLAHQEKVVYELNDVMVEDQAPTSINDRLKQQATVADRNTYLQEPPIRDLKKAITINDRMRFIRELFRDDEAMYERSIKTINGFNIYAEAEYWIQRELKLKLGWDNNFDLVKTFDQLVRRRFA